eukprot:SAG31_NODE_11107_length_1065_cov_1.564182_1_plen_197_part_00
MPLPSASCLRWPSVEVAVLYCWIGFTGSHHYFQTCFIKIHLFGLRGEGETSKGRSRDGPQPSPPSILLRSLLVAPNISNDLATIVLQVAGKHYMQLCYAQRGASALAGVVGPDFSPEGGSQVRPYLALHLIRALIVGSEYSEQSIGNINWNNQLEISVSSNDAACVWPLTAAFVWSLTATVGCIRRPPHGLAPRGY